MPPPTAETAARRRARMAARDPRRAGVGADHHRSVVAGSSLRVMPVLMSSDLGAITMRYGAHSPAANWCYLNPRMSGALLTGAIHTSLSKMGTLGHTRALAS